jgi:hypothetical protein
MADAREVIVKQLIAVMHNTRDLMGSYPPSRRSAQSLQDPDVCQVLLTHQAINLDKSE